VAPCTQLTPLRPCLQVNDSKGRISELKVLIEQRRIQRAVAAGSLSGEARAQAEGAEDAEEARCRAHIERVRQEGGCVCVCVRACACVCI